MRIAFVDPIPWNYTVATAYQQPLGGSQSALCYLAEALARRGHQVFAVTGGAVAGQSRGVTCVPLAQADQQGLAGLQLDFCVVLNAPGAAGWCRQHLAGGTRVILWTQHAADQPAVQPLADPNVAALWDAFVFVSGWQRDQYLRCFPIPPARTIVHGNAVAPAFEDLLSDGPAVLRNKPSAPVLAYTSTPFRGLDLLLEAFPSIRRQFPQVTLHVYSSMRVYQVSPLDDMTQYGGLYRACEQIDGVQYMGSVPQPELAGRLRRVTLLAYPNTFAETSCIAVMEAMAAGCWIVTSRLGALPETTAGFGTLLPMTRSRAEYRRQFEDAVVGLLGRYQNALQRKEIEATLERQIAFTSQHYRWTVRAQQWEQWLGQL